MCKGALKQALIKGLFTHPIFCINKLVNFREQKKYCLFSKPAGLMRNQTYE
jgi:hypothetical protein